MEEEQATSACISTVSMKLLPFWPADPHLWLAQVEAQFAIKGVTAQKTKFDYVVSSLSPEFATEVRNLLIHPPNDNPNDALKAQLIKRTATTDQHKLQRLLSTEELGDHRPMQLLRRMQQLVGDTPGLADRALLRELFLQRFPEVSVPSVHSTHLPIQTLQNLMTSVQR